MEESLDEKENTSEDIVAQAKERFKLSEEAFRDFRKQAEDDLKFRVGDQWDPEMRAKRESDGRPCITINRTNQFVNQITNNIRQNDQAIRVFPVDDKGDPEIAKTLQGLIRHIEHSSAADVAYTTASDHAASAGLGYFRVLTEFESPTSFNQRIKIAKIDNLFSVYLDPFSTEPDGSDARFGFIFYDMPKDEFKKKHPNLEACKDANWESRADEDGWISESSVRMAEYYYIVDEPAKLLLLSDGSTCLDSELEKYLAANPGVTVEDERETTIPVCKWAKIAGDEALEETEFPAPFIPIIPVYGAVVNINGKRHIEGIIRHLKDPQRMYNLWVTAETEMIALAPKNPFIGAKGQFEGVEHEWANANTETRAYLEYNPVDINGNPVGAPQRQNYEPPVMAITSARQFSMEDMKATVGMYDASIGNRSNETSGRAILGRQQQAETANFHFSDNLTRSIRHCGRIIVKLIPKIYDTNRIGRIIGEDGEESLVPLNKPVLENGIERILNDLTIGEYDVAVETGPSYATKRQESANSIMEFIQAYPMAAQAVGDLLVKNMDWQGASEIAERLKKLVPPHILEENEKAIPPEAQAQIQQMNQVIQQLQGALQDATLKLETKQLELASKERMKAAELEVDLQKKQMELSANPSLPEVLKQLQELQAYQVANGAPFDQSHLNVPQQLSPDQVMQMQAQINQNPTGGQSPGQF